MELLAKYAHCDVREAQGWTHIIMGRTYKRKCHKCGIEPPNGLQVTWGVNQSFFCRVCAFTKYAALECFQEHMRTKHLHRSTDSTGAR